MEALTIIILLVVIALLLFAIEAFILPGFGAAGICGAGCAVAASVVTFICYGPVRGMAVLLGSVVVVLAFFVWLSRSRALDRASLHATINSTAATTAQLSVKVGDEGVATTRLALIGNASLGGKTVEVKSADGFLDEGTPVVVVRVEEALVIVRRKEPTPPETP